MYNKYKIKKIILGLYRLKNIVKINFIRERI